MGVKTLLTLSQAQVLFPDIDITSLHPTHHGVIDTTYILKTNSSYYILKRYERASLEQITDESRLLDHLRASYLNVPRLLGVVKGWYLFTYIKGELPHQTSLNNLQSLGRFLGKMHLSTRRKKSYFTPFKKSVFKKEIKNVRLKHPLLAKELERLLHFDDKHDGIIHGDLFPDNAKFEKNRLGVFDFIEAGNGSFHFDAGITAMSWIAKEKKISKMKLQIFLNAYNQQAPYKLKLSELLTQMQYAALTYALQRWMNNEHELDYKQMLKKHSKIKSFKKSILNTSPR